jgi:hypothetical protein
MPSNMDQRLRFPTGQLAQGLADEFHQLVDAAVRFPTLGLTGDLLTGLHDVRSRIDQLAERDDEVGPSDPEWDRLREVAGACKEMCGRNWAERIWARERAARQTDPTPL